MSAQISTFKTTMLAAAGGLAVAAMIAIAGLAMTPREAAASAKYAQQTGKACNYCHTTPPALNAKGKAFQKKGHKM